MCEYFIRMMPKHYSYGTWPSSGEIDIVETRGNRRLLNREGVNVGADQVESTLHFGPTPTLNGYPFTNFQVNRTGGFNNDFHTYRMAWTPTSFEFAVDDMVLGVVNATADGGFWNRGRFDERQPGRENPWRRNTIMAPFDQEFYIIMNVAVGGVAYFGDDLYNEGSDKPWRNDSPQASKDFWDGRNGWLPTWNLGVDDSSHLQVDYVRVYAL
jgi:beta-glucanase (GH16 family)